MAVNTKDPNFQTFRQIYGDRILPFTDQDPTTEVMARRLFHELQSRMKEYAVRSDPTYRLRPDVKLRRIRLGETSSSWAEYEE